LGNYIGTDSAGTAAIPNLLAGINVAGPTNVDIGDGTAAGSNIIAYNGGDGISIGTGSGIPSASVTVSRNSIYANGGLGIDISPDAVTANNGTVSSLLPNSDYDYPIITSATLSGGTLSVGGFVGSNPAGSTTFAGATLEFFIADNSPANQDGEVIAADGRSVAHGEGRTYLGTCLADSNSLFSCSFSNAGSLGLTSATNITATATDSSGNTSEFGAAVASNPNILLVKRITRINDSKTTIGGDNLASYVDTSSPYDDNVDETPPFAGQPDPAKDDTTYWPDPSSFLIGGVNGGQIKSGDEIEYTIYFLSAGTSTARNVTLCDRIPTSQTFVPGAFNSTPIAPGGSSSSDHGIAVSYNGTAYSYSNLEDGDAAQYYFPGTTLPGACGSGANTTGAVVVHLGSGATNATGGSLPNATAPGTPTTSYGWIRFRAKVE
jgi:uncharacterized repeat protein (TIGR01451 family)